MSKEQAVYTHGHHESVTKDHSRRTAENSAAFLLPHIKSDFTILDVGCGPGSITVDLASLVPEGRVEGGDTGEAVLDQARHAAKSRGLTNVHFKTLDANNLDFPDAHFDIVFCHQVLQHVKDPVGVLREMRRVAKRGGIVAAREADYKSFTWYPELPGIAEWSELYLKTARANKGEPNAGRRLHVWAKEAGFEPKNIQASWDSWHYTDERAAQFAVSWSERILHSNFADNARNHGLASDTELQRISQTWKQWASLEDSLMVIPNGQILCWK